MALGVSTRQRLLREGQKYVRMAMATVWGLHMSVSTRLGRSPAMTSEHDTMLTLGASIATAVPAPLHLPCLICSSLLTLVLAA